MPPEQPPNATANIATIRGMLEETPRGLVTDVDGTISEIASAPELATVSSACRRYLRVLRETYDLVAVVSGRPLGDLKRMVGLDGLTYVGNHGLERWEDGRLHVERAAKRAASVLPRLVETVEGRLKGIGGLCLEHKTYGVAIHFRSAARPQAARQAILRAVADLPDSLPFSIMEGRRVVEVRPRGRADKGWALKALVRRHALKSFVYLGDDLTDARAFHAIRQLRRQRIAGAAAIAVVGDETPPEVIASADFALHGVAEVESFLAELSQSFPLAKTI